MGNSRITEGEKSERFIAIFAERSRPDSRRLTQYKRTIVERQLGELLTMETRE